ncbi:hypothetical protein ACFOWX_11000 [Sphingorhabdus arenilitoris]|uniref:Uncharacterized protein n=1 Tax=Sphingorhabdus arenilitoris TaxID=1490041 RepID=A0ABV8RJ66_9SPHN
MSLGLRNLGVVFAFTVIAACTPKPPPAPIPPPPPVIVAPPPPPARPLPPAGAAATLIMPPVGIDGVRETPNRFISSNEAVWHFRSAINVAALNCQGPVWDAIATNYNSFIGNNKLTLRKISKVIDQEYKTRYPGENALRVRDTKMTDLYNYFSLPTVRQEFCDAALIKSQEAAAVDWRVLPEYSVGALSDLDGIFIRFFDSYAQYEAKLAEWNRLYGAPAQASGLAPTGYAPSADISSEPIG